MAKTVILNLSFNELKHIYSNYQKNQDDISSTQMNSWILIFKCLVSYYSKDLATHLTERIGGAGYLCSNGVCELISFAHWSIVGLGDNAVLMEKVAKYGENEKIFKIHIFCLSHL